MEVRITFRSELYLEGKDMKEIAEKWEGMELFSNEANCAGACEVAVVSVEDNDTYDDLTEEFEKC
jgi:NADH:ubiquinone oxidoreductase subunit E